MKKLSNDWEQLIKNDDISSSLRELSGAVV